MYLEPGGTRTYIGSRGAEAETLCRGQVVRSASGYIAEFGHSRIA